MRKVRKHFTAPVHDHVTGTFGIVRDNFKAWMKRRGLVDHGVNKVKYGKNRTKIPINSAAR